MMDADILIRLSAARDYQDLQRKLRKKKDMRKKLRNRVSEAGKPVLADVRAAVIGLHVTGSGGGGYEQRRAHNVSRAKTERAVKVAERRRTGLRRTVASATRLQVTAKGVLFTVDGNRLPDNQRGLPWALDAEKGWWHPVYGRRDRKRVHQQGGPWFASTIDRHAPAFRRAIVEAMDEIIRDLEG